MANVKLGKSLAFEVEIEGSDRKVRIDPLAVILKLQASGIADSDGNVRLDGSPESLEALRQAMGLPDLDYLQTVELLNAFVPYVDEIQKKMQSMQTLPASTASSPTMTSSDSASTSTSPESAPNAS